MRFGICFGAGVEDDVEPSEMLSIASEKSGPLFGSVSSVCDDVCIVDSLSQNRSTHIATAAGAATAGKDGTRGGADGDEAAGPVR